MNLGTIWVRFMEKTRGWKSRATVPLSVILKEILETVRLDWLLAPREIPGSNAGSGVITPVPLAETTVHNNSASCSAATNVIKKSAVLPSLWRTGINLQRRVGILYRHHRYRYKFDYPASSVAAYTKAAFIAALEVAELLFTMVSVTGTGVTIPPQAPGSARHLYVICIYGAICLQISKNKCKPDPAISSSR